MGMLSQLMAAPGGVDPIHNFWYGPAGARRVVSGVTVNHNTAMNYSACWAAKRLLTEMIATLPRVMYKRSNGMKVHAEKHPTYRPFCSEPNIRQGGVNFHAQQFGFVIDWGMCFAEKIMDDLGRTLQTWPIHPSRVPKENVKRNADGTLSFLVKNDKGPPTLLGVNADGHQEMFYVPGILCEDDVYGKGVIQYAAESIGMGIATEQYGASHFGNGGGPSIVLTHPKQLGKEGADNLRRSWQTRFSGPDKANGLLVLEEDTKVEHLSYPPEANQFLMTRQFNITEIARWYNVPPHLLRELSRSTNNNIENESLHFVLISIMPWLIRYEDECNRQLLIEEEKGTYFFKFLLQGLLRGDMAARATFYKEMFAMGVYSVNDILELEDRNPIGPKGDIRLVPMNMATLDYVFANGNTGSKKDEAKPPKKEKPPAKKPVDEDEQLKEMNSVIAGLLRQTNDISAEMLTVTSTLTDADTTRMTLATAAQSVLSSTISDMIWYEAKKASREAANSRSFEAWCNSFYSDKFKTLFADKVRPMLAASTPFGVTLTAEQLTDIHCDQSRQDLLSLLETPNKEFASAVQTTVENWESRAFTEAAMVFTSDKGQNNAG
jgi:HK97 family phage portal protein